MTEGDGATAARPESIRKLRSVAGSWSSSPGVGVQDRMFEGKGGQGIV